MALGRRYDRRFGDQLDHHLNARLDDILRDDSVVGKLQSARLDLERNAYICQLHVGDVKDLVFEIEDGLDFGLEVVGLVGGDKSSDKGGFARYEWDAAACILHTLDKVDGRDRKSDGVGVDPEAGAGGEASQ